MRRLFLGAIAIAGLVGNLAAMADEPAVQQTAQVNASLDQQSTSAQVSDPTASHSLRSHGRP